MSGENKVCQKPYGDDANHKHTTYIQLASDNSILFQLNYWKRLTQTSEASVMRSSDMLYVNMPQLNLRLYKHRDVGENEETLFCILGSITVIIVLSEKNEAKDWYIVHFWTCCVWPAAHWQIWLRVWVLMNKLIRGVCKCAAPISNQISCSHSL